jgi:hypothetical protein
MGSRKKWLKDLRDYESSIRNKQVKYLCNKKDIEQMRFALRVLLDDAERPTQLAPDAGDSAAFSSIFLASDFSCSHTLSTPAPAPVTQTVGRLSFK